MHFLKYLFIFRGSVTNFAIICKSYTYYFSYINIVWHKIRFWFNQTCVLINKLIRFFLTFDFFLFCYLNVYVYGMYFDLLQLIFLTFDCLYHSEIKQNQLFNYIGTGVLHSVVSKFKIILKETNVKSTLIYSITMRKEIKSKLLTSH